MLPFRHRPEKDVLGQTLYFLRLLLKKKYYSIWWNIEDILVERQKLWEENLWKWSLLEEETIEKCSCSTRVCFNAQCVHFHWSCCVTQQCLGETFIGKKWDQNSSDQSATSSNTRTLLWTQCHALKWPPAHNDTQTPAHPIECFSSRQRAHLSDYSQDTLALWRTSLVLLFFRNNES